MTPTRPDRQRGAALLTAMVIVTIVATLASSMIWQQWRAVQVETAERTRTQSQWILTGALDWARLILREDARSGGIDHLGEPWAVPLAEARLSTFLAADKDNADDAPEAFLSGRITDMQGLFNLRNLVDQGVVVPAEQRSLERLCETVGVAPTLAAKMADGLRRSLTSESTASSSDNADVPLTPHTVAQFAWLGIDAASLARLEPYVTILPVRTQVNINTAPREVIAAEIDGMDVGTAERLVQMRQRNPFRGLDEVRNQLPGSAALDTNRIVLSSSFFEVRGRLRLGTRVLEQRSLVERRGLEVVLLRSERVNLTG